jgi:hypothetical protein
MNLDGKAAMITGSGRLATDEALFGRIMVGWNCQPPQFISQCDPGLQTLD